MGGGGGGHCRYKYYTAGANVSTLVGADPKKDPRFLPQNPNDLLDFYNVSVKHAYIYTLCVGGFLGALAGVKIADVERKPNVTPAILLLLP